MKINKRNARLQKDRPRITITLRMPEDVVEDLKRVAPHKGIAGYQPLIRAYVGQGLREDLEALDAQTDIETLLASLEMQRVKRAAIEKAFEAAGVSLAGQKA